MANDKSADLSRSWYDPAWVPLLNQTNVLDYFMQHSNPFYDRTCNNEVIKMQRLNPEQLQTMTGLEYVMLLHQEPILYVIQKRHRQSPTQFVPLINYYVIAGAVYQSPDLQSVVSSRLINTVFNLQSAFDTARGYQNFTPSRGYWWDFKNTKYNEEKQKTKDKKKEEPSSLFQRQRVDLLLVELSKKYPPKQVSVTQQAPPPPNDKTEHTEIKSKKYPPKEVTVTQVPPPSTNDKTAEDIKVEIKVEVKSEKSDAKSVASTDNTIKPPPEKKLKMAR